MIKLNSSYRPEMSVQYVKGVGPKIAEKLSKLGIHTIEDILHYYPRAWEDRRQFCPLRDIQVSREMTFRGTVASVHFTETRGGFAIVQALIRDETGELLCKWMRKRSFRYDVLQSFKEELHPGVQLIVHGTISKDLTDKIMDVEEHEVLTGSVEDFIHIGRIVPVYPLTKGLRQKFIRELIYGLKDLVPLDDPLPAGIQKSHNLIPLKAAIEKIHFPGSMDEKEKARQRLAFQELFLIQTALALARKRRRVKRDYRYEIKKNLLSPFRQKCGFEFTRPQKKAIREIFADLTAEFPMNRLLQGDVGSGKTIVAISAMLLACENRFQSVLMAPTEILAEQHFITLKYFIESLPVTVGLLTGSVKGKERKKFLEECANGKIDIAIGTHALLENEVQFRNLGLAVIDEQHRFGVRHRLALTRRKPVPDVLVMTATPIPRTLALGLYGDLDISTIDELPPGRQKIATFVKTENEAYAFMKQEIKKKHQAYIVFPLVDESDKIELKAAIKEFEKLKTGALKDYAVGLLHGQMTSREKERTMKDFHNGTFSILVTTTVIEVGIDVSNATVMIIQHAERFGLSTLHQLRGRIGRGKDPSCCILISHAKTEEAQRRIDILLGTQDGFTLAEADLELRGPGEIFGTSQHGFPPLKIASFITDKALIVESQKAARECVAQDSERGRKENVLLRKHLRKHFSKNWFWANIL